ncbi:flagellar hook-basal body complex protein [Clostridium sp. HMP27]|uniref:flagellar hook-basal body complex protein n=1 Tax=Clostridium sp. HMP27 TaxID=1487921 RepID=UPI00052C980B|nr:flagellar hook-basal body complex protein [Clostridium sp. HMP27]KGK86119.1 flagellar basal body rod protein FlgG [Clostridium sp. HMP27]
MIRGLYTAVSGMITQEAKQDVVTNNLANVNTVGFKVDNLATKSFNEVLLSNRDKIVNGKNVKVNLGTINFGSKIDEVATSFTQGTLDKTDKETDFAINGRGFFVVERNTGINAERYYTRDGHFHVNSQGFLVNDNGDNVIGINTETGVEGPINTNVSRLDQFNMMLVDFQDYNSLTKIGDNMYSGEGQQIAANGDIKQYSLEKSNVNITREMIEMMTVMRTFETNQKIIQSLDETLGKAANEIGRV